jgi:hypothetical protein
VPDLVARRLQRHHDICTTTYNAGFTFYAPAIFVPLARTLVPMLRPDYVVVDIDETDLVDDAYRYDALITRNAKGENVGVKPSPPLLAFSAGLVAMRSHWFYLHRMVDKLWLTLITVPRLERERPVPDLFLVARNRDPPPEKKYAAEFAIFERNIAELIGVLKQTVPADRIVFVSHPHLQHLLPPGNAERWNDATRAAVRKVATSHGALFLTARRTCRAASPAIHRTTTCTGTCTSISRAWADTPTRSPTSWRRRCSEARTPSFTSC